MYTGKTASVAAGFVYASQTKDSMKTNDDALITVLSSFASFGGADITTKAC